MTAGAGVFGRGSSMARTRGRASPWRHLDMSLLFAVLFVAGMGVLMVYSATRHRFGADPSFFMQRQLLFVLLGVGVMAVCAWFDYGVLRDQAPLLYCGTVLILVAVLTPLGSNSKGAQAWFQLGSFQFQPSEWCKPALIICVAAYAAAHRGDLDGRRLLTLLVLAGLPMALIELQPDLGTDLVFAAILLATVLVAGARGRHMAALGLLAVVGVVAVFHLGLLKEYQRDRLTAFLDPKGDTLRSAYNLNQSKLAISHGGVTGQGLFKGTQTNLSYVPEQHTDFIFTVVGEELGLVGSATLLALYAFIVWRMWRAAALAKDLSGTLICIGVLAMFVFQLFENVGMTMGIMPITGIPLPFLSYGGSATLASFAAVGLVLNVHMRRFS
jgi:rod shape determining protein RodA